jgi:uncharacterized YigZ family protein
MDLYSIQNSPSGEYRDKGSKFFSYIHKIDSQDAYKSYIAFYKEKFPDACHVCSAYRLFIDGRVDEYATDDGEPKGSSGLPILNKIKHYNVINVGLFVVRIFGGTKLGIPGLISAYGTAAENALHKIIKQEWKPTVLVSVNYSYEYTNLIEQLVSQFEAEIVQQFFSQDIFIQLKIELGLEEKLNSILIEKSAGKLQIN